MNSFQSFTNERLIALFKNTENPDLLGELYLRYHRMVWSICVKIVGDHDAASDITHDVFLKAFSQLNKLEHPSLFGFWVGRIAKNESISFCKKQRRIDYDSEKLLTCQNSQGVEASVNQYKEQLLAIFPQAMDSLLPIDQEVLSLKYFDNYSIKDLQTIYGISQSAVKMRLVRARKRIANAFRTVVPDETSMTCAEW